MREIKCKMTVTGKHMWIEKYYDQPTGETSGTITYTKRLFYWGCRACGMIDDRKTIREIK